MLLSVSSGDSALGILQRTTILLSSLQCCAVVCTFRESRCNNQPYTGTPRAWRRPTWSQFLKAGNLAAGTDVLELCVVAERISSRETIAGAQRIRGLW